MANRIGRLTLAGILYIVSIVGARATVHKSSGGQQGYSCTQQKEHELRDY